MNCTCCGTHDDLRFGVCFDCASAAELRAAKRTVLQHLRQAARNCARRAWSSARVDLCWAWERLTGTGDYAIGGTFDAEYPGWR